MLSEKYQFAVWPLRQNKRLLLPAGVLAMTLAVSTFALATQKTVTASTQAPPFALSFADVVERVSPAVVNISVVRETPQNVGTMSHGPYSQGPYGGFGFRQSPHPFGGDKPARQRLSQGSGFVIDSEGYLVTNAHVVEGVKEITVTFQEEESFEASLVGVDRETDLALLKIEGVEDLPIVTFGSSENLRPGDWVVTVGNPFGLGGTVTAGIVSARSRELAGARLVDFLQIDAPINKGNSGGPAFNAAGEVIGINTAIYSPTGGSVGIGFAVPSDLASVVIADLRDDGEVERGWLGVRIQPLDEDLAKAFDAPSDAGALIAEVESDSPAERAGLRAGDIVSAWDGQKVEELRDLPRLVTASKPDSVVPVEVYRKGEAMTLAVTTGTLGNQEAKASPMSERSGAEELKGKARLGLRLRPLNEQERERLDLASDRTGLLVLQTREGGVGEKAGLRPGDVILEADGESLSKPKDLLGLFNDRLDEGGEQMAILVLRRGAPQYLALSAPDDQSEG